MILMRANPLQGPLERGALIKENFVGPEMAPSKAGAIGSQKSLDFQYKRNEV